MLIKPLKLGFQVIAPLHSSMIARTDPLNYAIKIASLTRPKDLMGNTFQIYKFRTMRVDTSPNLSKEDARQYILPHPLAYFLRRTSLDELPRYRNIEDGDLAAVGADVFNCQEWDNLPKEIFNFYIPGAITLTTLLGRHKLDPQKRAELSATLLNQITRASYLRIFFLTFLEPFKFSGI